MKAEAAARKKAEEEAEAACKKAEERAAVERLKAEKKAQRVKKPKGLQQLAFQPFAYVSLW